MGPNAGWPRTERAEQEQQDSLESAVDVFANMDDDVAAPAESADDLEVALVGDATSDKE